MVSPSSSSVTKIREKVRRLTNSPNEKTLATATIDEYMNTFYTQDFPSALKVSKVYFVYEIFTRKGYDEYPIDLNQVVNLIQPAYIDGTESDIVKTRQEFFRYWPRSNTSQVPATGDGVTLAFAFTISEFPILRSSITIGGEDTSGAPIRVDDDGEGNLRSISQDALNNITYTNIGTVNYETGVFSLTFLTAPASGTNITVRYDPVSYSKPRNILYWNGALTVRPVPDGVYKVEINGYKYPDQFTDVSDTPLINQWWQYIAYGTAIKILEDRHDNEGANQIKIPFSRQEGLILEAMANNEIGQATPTIYSGNFSNYAGDYGVF